MESALSYLSGLVEAFEDVSKKRETKRSTWDQTGISSCNINVTNSTDDFYCGAGYNGYDVEGQDVQDGDDGIIQQSASNVSSKRRRQCSSIPSISEKKSFSGIAKSRGLSILQSFSAGSSNRHDALNVPDVSKSHSSLSNTTNESMTDVDDVEHDDTFWVGDDDDDMSFDSKEDFAEHRPSKSRRHPKLPPPPSRYHVQWFAHGVTWTCMAIFCGWMAFGFSYTARQSTSFVALKDPMYLDPRYQTIPQVGMIRMELCFNETHLDILQELNDYDFRLEEGPLELGVQPRTRNADSKHAAPHEYYARAADEFADDDDDDEIDISIAKKANSHCIIHRLTSDDVHDDAMYTVSQATSFLSMVLGGFITICLTFSAFWKTINLRPIGGGFLLAYFLQSFTFLIFDSNLCKDNMGCSMSGGGTYSALASACWILACAATARMDRRKFRNLEKELAALEEQYREFRRSEYRNSRRIDDEEEPHPHEIEASEESINTEKPRKPKSVSNISSDETSTLENGRILQDSKELKEDPIYIPALPKSPQNSDRCLNNKPTNDELNDMDAVEKPKKTKSKKSKSKSKKDQTLETSSSLSTNNDSTKKPKKSKKKTRKGRQSQHMRSPSPSKSIDMAGDVVDTVDVVDEHVKAIIKNSAWISDRTTNEIIGDKAVKKPSSSRSRRSKSTPRPKNAAMRESVRRSIQEGKHYEL